MLIKGIDGDAPTATDYRSALLKRATYTIPGVRPEIISEETFHLLNALRAHRHKLRRIYTYLVSSTKIMNLTDIALKSFDKFKEDWDPLKRYLLYFSPK